MPDALSEVAPDAMLDATTATPATQTIRPNDNVDALRFYQRRGMRLVRLWPDAVTQARKLLKPEIPLVGADGITVRDELELDCLLAGPNPVEGAATS